MVTMGNKKEAVRLILERVPEWPDDNDKTIRLDADDEVLTCSMSAAEIFAAVEYGSHGVMSRSTSHGFLYGERRSLPTVSPHTAVMGEPISRMEYEIFRAAILHEMGAGYGQQERSSKQDHETPP